MQTLTIPAFDSYVCLGDSIAIEDGLYTFTARIEFDDDTSPDEFDCFDVNCPDYGEENAKYIRAWRNGEWFYCGIAISAEYNGFALPGNYLASLWGIEANFPGSDNAYLSEVVSELLPEAKERATELLNTIRAKLAA